MVFLRIENRISGAEVGCVAAAALCPLRALIERKIASKGDGVWPLI
jgi:hypothetical protein